jgi:hypothetical protein
MIRHAHGRVWRIGGAPCGGLVPTGRRKPCQRPRNRGLLSSGQPTAGALVTATAVRGPR